MGVIGGLHARRTLFKGEQQARLDLDVDVEERGCVGVLRGKPIHDGLMLGHGLEPGGVAEDTAGKDRVDLFQAAEQGESRLLGDEQVVVVRIVLGAPRGYTDAHHQTQAQQIEEHIDFCLRQREGLGVATDNRPRRLPQVGRF